MAKIKGNRFVRLENNGYFTARNAANSADVNLFKLNGSDVFELALFPQKSGSPTADNELVNKAYVDGIAMGLAWKDSVRAIATSNITLSGAQTIDGVSIIAGDRVLVAGQTLGENNGIYLAAAGAWSRATDADSAAEILQAAMFIEEGTTYGDSAWVNSTNAPITLGTTPLVFVQFSGAGAIVAGNGLTKTGNTLDVVAGDASILSNANDIQVQRDAAGAIGLATGIKINLESSNPSLQISSNELGAKLYSGGAIVKNASGLAANVDGVTIKVASNALQGLIPEKEEFTLVAGDITNQYIDLLQVAATDSIHFYIKGGYMAFEGDDYTISYTGGAGGKTRISFAGGDLATGGPAALVATDVIQIKYLYL